MKASEAERNNPTNDELEKTFGSGSKIINNTVENKKPKNKLIPPNEGFDLLLQRTVTSFLFLIPSVWENRKSILLTISEITNEPKKKSR